MTGDYQLLRSVLWCCAEKLDKNIRANSWFVVLCSGTSAVWCLFLMTRSQRNDISPTTAGAIVELIC